MRRLCRLSVLYRVRLSEVASWPAWEIDLIEHYLAREPAPIERVEVALAHLAAMYHSAHQKQGAPQKKIADFMLYAKAWPAAIDGRYNEIDMQVLQELL